MHTKKQKRALVEGPIVRLGLSLNILMKRAKWVFLDSAIISSQLHISEHSYFEGTIVNTPYLIKKWFCLIDIKNYKI